MPYYLDIMYEFYANYIAILKNMGKNKEKAMDKTNMDRIPVEGYTSELVRLSY